jgi:hypothetical protein
MKSNLEVWKSQTSWFQGKTDYVTIYLTNSMQLSHSWEANSYSANQIIPRFLWNPKVHNRVHNSSLLVPILTHTNPAHTFPSYFPNIHSNITLPSTPRSSEWSRPFRFSNQNFVCISHLSHSCCMSHSSYPPLSDHANNIWWSLQVIRLLTKQSPTF